MVTIGDENREAPLTLKDIYGMSDPGNSLE